MNNCNVIWICTDRVRIDVVSQFSNAFNINVVCITERDKSLLEAESFADCGKKNVLGVKINLT